MVAFVLFCVWCAVLSWFDCAQRRLPNRLTLPGSVVIVVCGIVIGSARAVVVGAVLLAAAYLVVHLISARAMGAGDVKLAIGLGAAAALGGAHCWVLAAVVAPIGTALAGLVVVLVRGRVGLQVAIPHGPFMCGATLIALWASG